MPPFRALLHRRSQRLEKRLNVIQALRSTRHTSTQQEVARLARAIEMANARRVQLAAVLLVQSERAFFGFGSSEAFFAQSLACVAVTCVRCSHVRANLTFLLPQRIFTNVRSIPWTVSAR